MANGAKVRLGTEVTGIDPAEGKVRLSTGEVLSGDVIVGADGAKGLTRPLVVEDGHDDTPSHRTNFYAWVELFIGLYACTDIRPRSVIPRSLIAQDPDLAWFLEEENSVSCSSRGLVVHSADRVKDEAPGLVWERKGVSCVPRGKHLSTLA